MLRIVQERIINGVTQEQGSVEISTAMVILFACIVVGIYIAFYVLRSIGLYKLARRQNVAHAFLAWIPCVWMFTACKIIGNTKIFGNTAEKLAIWACVIFSFATIIPFAYNFLVYFPYVMYYIQGGSIDLIVNGSVVIQPVTTAGITFNNLFDTPAIDTVLKILYAVNYIFRFGEIFINVFLYINLFRKFWPEHYILAAVLSFFGLFPILVFAIRDREEVDFNEYLRKRYYGSGYTPYGGNGYGNNEGQRTYYGSQGGVNNGQSEQNNDPFDEFSGRPEEPFGEFSDNKNDGSENDKN